MPFKYVCDKCKSVLWHSDLPKSIVDVIKMYEGKCPGCKEDLVKDVSKVDIKGYGSEVGPGEYPPKKQTDKNGNYATAEPDS